ncbi:MAG: arylesterase [Burkholderiales bacterium]|nr:arylesterase [Burkholderiales bacterium]
MDFLAAGTRRHRAAATAGAALLLAGCALAGCSGNVAKLPQLPADAVVLAFGDSLTFGTGAQAEASYPAVLQKLIGRTVANAGVPGEVSAAGLARLPDTLDEYQPALLILCHGGNDFLRKLGDAQAAENLRAMIRLAKERGIGVVLIAVPKPGLLPSPPDFYAGIAREFGLPYEAEALKTILRDKGLKSDLAHPNAEGYTRLAQAVAALLKKSGAV